MHSHVDVDQHEKHLKKKNSNEENNFIAFLRFEKLLEQIFLLKDNNRTNFYVYYSEKIIW